MARHEVLRTTFAMVDGEPVQRILQRRRAAFILWSTICADAASQGGTCSGWWQRKPRPRFDLEAGPLIRGRLIRLAEEKHVLLITMHHIVSDGWSMGIFTNELSTLYGAFLRGEADPLPELEVQYADYAVWQRKWMEGEVCSSRRSTGRGRWRGRRRCWSCRRIMRGRQQQDYARGRS